MKIGIVTINNSNYGNRLQNYATQEILKKYNIEPITIKNISLMNKKKNNFEYILRNIKHIYHRNDWVDLKEREKLFKLFNKNIFFTKRTFNWFKIKWLEKFDFFITGSDQVWNPVFRLTDFDLLTFTIPQKRIAFSASIGVNKIPNNCKKKFKESVENFKAVSVREDAGKKIIEDLTGRKDVEVLVDPTMLLTADEWDKVSRKPDRIKDNKKYILNYFLGGLSDTRKKEIERIAEENDCYIINILDKNDPFYISGPSEFLWLEKNAFLICTDSFHSSVFGILYNTPFIVFNREENGNNMNSRLDTLLKKFKLEDRYFNGKITNDMLKIDYSESYKILEEERKKSKKFLEKALDISKS